MTAQQGVDGQTRDAKGNLRFNKNNKQARQEDMTMMDDLEEGDSQSKKKVAERRKKRIEMGKLGGEFKAKVSIAETDGERPTANDCRGPEVTLSELVDLIRIRMFRSAKLREGTTGRRVSGCL